MTGQRLVLVVDDDPHIVEVVVFALSKAGFRTASASDGREGLELFRRLDPDLVVLDVMMKEMDGTEVCRAIRAESKRPVLFLSSRDDEIDRVVGLELGGDDYVTKPFSPRELVARIRAILRRTESEGSPAHRESYFVHGSLRLETDTFRAFWEGSEVPLTATEFGIVRTLLRTPGRVFSRDELMDGAYEGGTYVSDRTIDSHIRRIRRKFADVGGSPVETVHGVGYRAASPGGER